VTISGKVIIGSDVYIKSGAVIGQKGFGFERDDSGTPVLFPQLGGVRIGDRVEVGALSTIARGALGDTVVSDDVKLDDHVHIAHNVEIGPRCLVTAGAVVSGSVKIGSDVWIGPNATTTNAIEIGGGATISLGAVVARDVKPGKHVSGNFAEPHDKFLQRYLNIKLPRTPESK
jgi:UDP-3-O-[3-hydroxymyristoyl] glucosamine N-acyltransferase LpxD